MHTGCPSCGGAEGATATFAGVGEYGVPASLSRRRSRVQISSLVRKGSRNGIWDERLSPLRSRPKHLLRTRGDSLARLQG